MAPLISYAASRFPQTELGEDVLIVVQIEGREGLKECGSIAKVPGVDAVSVGVYDLSRSLGQPGNVASREVADAVSRVATEAADTMLGIYVDDPALSQTLARQGFRLQCVSFDGRMLLEGARTALLTAKDGAR
jgi:4-hydroxy-2-oxoheptanedioate aldolase